MLDSQMRSLKNFYKYRFENGIVIIRDRDTGEQERVHIDDLLSRVRFDTLK